MRGKALCGLGTESRRVVDERVLRRLLRTESQRMMAGNVRAPRPLRHLLMEREPTAPTREGGVHRFDVDAVRRLADALPALVRADLRLPILFFVDHEYPQNAFVMDQAAMEALQTLGVATGRPRDGKLWVSMALARHFAHEYPRLAQFVVR